MIGLAFTLTYLGWTALCFAMPSHARNLRGRPFAQPVVIALRWIGGIALLVSLLACAHTWGWPNGTTAWFGVLTLACLALIGLLAVNTRAALLPIALLPVAGLLVIW